MNFYDLSRIGHSRYWRKTDDSKSFKNRCSIVLYYLSSWFSEIFMKRVLWILRRKQLILISSRDISLGFIYSYNTRPIDINITARVLDINITVIHFSQLFCTRFNVLRKANGKEVYILIRLISRHRIIQRLLRVPESDNVSIPPLKR